jgi:FtsP/CotA-like multicopper oxidase with cupredoxin domain
MTVVAADGQNVQPVETDEFQIAIAETYDVIVEPGADEAYGFVAEASTARARCARRWRRAWAWSLRSRHSANARCSP